MKLKLTLIVMVLIMLAATNMYDWPGWAAAYKTYVMARSTTFEYSMSTHEEAYMLWYQAMIQDHTTQTKRALAIRLVRETVVLTERSCE